MAAQLAAKVSEKDSVFNANAIDECRAIALGQFMGDFRRSMTRYRFAIGILEQKGYSVADILDALAEWVGKQPKYSDVVQHLEKAGNEAARSK